MTAPAPSAAPVHTRPRHVVVVGGGAMGVCTAYYLLSAPDPPRVTLVEAHALGQGASGRASGFMALDWHGPTTTSLAELSWRLHADLATAHDGAGVWGYRAVDSISYAMQASSAASTPATEHTEAPRLTRRESSSEIPPVSLNGELDQTWLNVEGEINLLGTMDTTALVTPYAFVKAIFEIARSKGLIYVHGRPDRLNTSSDGHPQSLHIQLRDRNAQLKETIVPCDGLVVSAGPWTSHVLEALGLPILPVGSAGGHSITIQIPPGQKISPTAVFASIHGVNRRPRMDASGRMVFSTARTTEAPELFPRPDGTVFVAGEDDELHPPDDPADVDESTNAEMAARLMRATRYVSGVLAGGVVLKKELSYRPMISDGRPMIGRLAEGVFVGIGHGPWGVALSTGTGKVLSELIMDGEASSADIQALCPTRFF